MFRAFRGCFWGAPAKTISHADRDDSLCLSDRVSLKDLMRNLSALRKFRQAAVYLTPRQIPAEMRYICLLQNSLTQTVAIPRAI